MPDLLQPDPAHGVFETTLVVRGVPLELDAHLERLRASLHELYGIAVPAGAHARVLECAAGLPLGRVRVSVTPRGDGAPLVEAVAQPVERATVLPPWELGIELRAVAVEGWCGAHKWADRRLLEQLDKRAAPASALLVAGDRGVLETTRANVFAVGDDGALRTPPADGAVLPGVTRARVLALARAAGVAVREERLQLADLHAAREVFTTGSVRGVEPVRSLDGVALAGPGPVAALLVDELRLQWLGDSVAA